MPASARRFATQPPAAPEPTTSTSKVSCVLLCTEPSASCPASTVRPAAERSSGPADGQTAAAILSPAPARCYCRGQRRGRAMTKRVELPVVGETPRTLGRREVLGLMGAAGASLALPAVAQD